MSPEAGPTIPQQVGLIGERLTALEGRPDLAQPLTDLAERVEDIEEQGLGDAIGGLAEASPTGAAGGDLEGTYPNPTLKEGTVDTAELSGPLQAALLASGWSNLELGPKIEAGPLQTPGVRREGSSARLRGQVKVKAGEELKVAETLFTIPNVAGFRPPATIEISLNTSAGVAVKLIISAAGVATVNAALGAGVSIPLDSETFNNV